MTNLIFLKLRRSLNLARGSIEIHCEYSLRTDFASFARFSIATGQTEMKMFISVDRFHRTKRFDPRISSYIYLSSGGLNQECGPRLPVHTPEIYLRSVKHIRQYI